MLLWLVMYDSLYKVYPPFTESLHDMIKYKVPTNLIYSITTDWADGLHTNLSIKLRASYSASTSTHYNSSIHSINSNLSTCQPPAMKVDSSLFAVKIKQNVLYILIR